MKTYEALQAAIDAMSDRAKMIETFLYSDHSYNFIHTIYGEKFMKASHLRSKLQKKANLLWITSGAIYQEAKELKTKIG